VRRRKPIREIRPPRSGPRLRAHRVLSALAASVLFSGMALVLSTSAAQAYSCSGIQSGTVVSSVSEVSFNIHTGCNDKLFHITGTVYDTSCDGREAFGSFDAYTVPEVGGTYFDWERTAHADNGCGTSGTFSVSGATPIHVSGDAWEIAVCVYAKNSTSSSKLTCSDRRG
jgi:hypothetical protein